MAFASPGSVRARRFSAERPSRTDCGSGDGTELSNDGPTCTPGNPATDRFLDKLSRKALGFSTGMPRNEDRTRRPLSPRHQVVGFPNQRRLEQLIVIRIAEAGLLPGVRDPSGDRFQLSQIDPF